MKMKKFINNPENLTPELLEGFAEAHKDLVTLGENRMIINNKLAEADRVTIVTQGGSGHEPAISGFVGEGMVDISVVGDVFAAPGPQACLDAIKLADKGKGVLYIVLNHAGDMLTGNLTMKKCAKEGLNVVKVVTQEDIANAPRSNADDRRGLVGCIPTYKIAGAAAAEGKSLEEVAAIAQRFADNMATLAVAVSGATHPATGSLLADLGEDEMEIGMGQHGEHAIAHFLLKAVHHRKHDDERHDAQGDGSDRNARNKAHETVFATAASTGSRVAQSDGNFKRKSQDVFSRIGLLF